MIGLTRKQRELYDFIVAEMSARGVAPSLAEMATHLNVSVSRIFALLVGLQDKNYIRRLPGQARAIEIAFASVTLNSEILTLTDAYAAEHKISRDTAANELLRQALGAAA